MKESKAEMNTERPFYELEDGNELKGKDFSKYELRDMDCIEKYAKPSEEELLEILNPSNYSGTGHFINYISNEFEDDLLSLIYPIFNSPYPKDYIIKILNKVAPWERIYAVGPEVFKEDGIHERSNKWLFLLIKNMKLKNPIAYEKFYQRFKKEYIDHSININTSEISYSDILRKQYGKYQLPELVTDLRGCIGVCHGQYYMKEKIEGQYVISKCSRDRFIDELGLFKPFKGNNNISLLQIFRKFSNNFLYTDIGLSKENKEGIINYFQGYKHKEIITDDFTILQPLLNHVKHIICRDNEAKYEYIMNWFANIIQNISVKNGTLPIIHGAQGSGKSLFAELMCELLGNLAIYNNDDLDKVFGKFNSISDGKVLIILNETAEADEKFSYSEKLKSRITQIHTIYESKGVDQRCGYNYANYIMTSNNHNPIRSQKGDRRTIYFPTNNEKIGDFEYFDNLFKDFQPVDQGEYNPKYMGVLLHYMLTQYHPENFKFQRLIIETNNNTETEFNENLERQYNDLNAVEQYMVDNSREFIIGYTRINTLSISGYTKKALCKVLNKYCNTKRIRMNSKESYSIHQQIHDIFPNRIDLIDDRDSSKITVYRFKEEKEIPDFMNIVKYKQYQENLTPSNEKEEI